jgi:hypothetical protein
VLAGENGTRILEVIRQKGGVRSGKEYQRSPWKEAGVIGAWECGGGRPGEGMKTPIGEGVRVSYLPEPVAKGGPRH